MNFDVLGVRSIGDREGGAVLYPFVAPDGATVALEPPDGPHPQQAVANSVTVFETKPRSGQKLVGVSNAAVWLTVTDSRVTMACERYDRGSRWFGFGDGAFLAAAANIVSSAAAARRRQGKLLVGQVRYEWLASIALRRRRGFLGEDQLRLTLGDHTGSDLRELSVVFGLPKGINSAAIAANIAARTTLHRCTPAERAAGAALGDLDNLPWLKATGSGFSVYPIPGSVPAGAPAGPNRPCASRPESAAQL